MIWIRTATSTEKESQIHYLESRIRGVESRIQDCHGFSYMKRNLTLIYDKRAHLRKIVVHTNLLPMTLRVTFTSFKSWMLAAMQKYCPASVIFMSLIWRFPFASCLNLFLSNFPRSLPQLISDVGRPVALHRSTIDLPTAAVVFLGVVIKLTAGTIKKKKVNNKMFCTIFLALYWLSGRSAMEKDANKQTKKS